MKNTRLFYILLVLLPYLMMTEVKAQEATPFIEELLGKMTLEEKIGQLNLPGSGDVVTGQAKNSDIAKKIEAGMVGGLLNITSVQKIKEVQ